MNNIRFCDLLKVIEPGSKICVRTRFRFLEGFIEEIIESKYSNKEWNVSSMWFSVMYDAIMIEADEPEDDEQC